MGINTSGSGGGNSGVSEATWSEGREGSLVGRGESAGHSRLRIRREAPSESQRGSTGEEFWALACGAFRGRGTRVQCRRDYARAGDVGGRQHRVEQDSGRSRNHEEVLFA